ncbi:hypothetical protein [Acerihabitans arboris]|uniref:Uncharacterized protein n=1 Tax=Acerihabitans arboris TaxID=2691583 RepID=A0A845SLH6_9GAMM|nr:hypothetical protein [Acerihabitans arboris]NDL64232.1 hypothetical protein [Acerihabitans arboris]
MKNDTGITALTTVCWAALCAVLATTITSSFFTLQSLLILSILFLAPLLLRPVSCMMSRFRKPVFLLIKKRNRYWLHLNPWLSTGRPSLRCLSLLWQSLLATIRLSLDDSALPVVMSSHLFGPNRIARLRRYFPARHYLFHVIKRPVGRTERVGLQIDTWLREWRWFTPAERGAVVVIRRRKELSPTDK